jgi:hypothetical protein
MGKQLHMLPECFADTLLVNRLTHSETNHKHSISKVFTALKDSFKDSLAVGIIDDDKQKDKYFDEFKQIEDELLYRYMAHPNGKHFILAIKGGGIEKLIINCAAEVEYQHDLLNDVDTLKARSKSIVIDPEVRTIINTLIRLKSPTLVRIREILMQHIK